MKKHLLTLRIILIIWILTSKNYQIKCQTLKTYFLDIVIEDKNNTNDGPNRIRESTPSSKQNNNVLMVQEKCRSKKNNCLIDTLEVYQNFDFQMQQCGKTLFWSNEFENRFLDQLHSPKNLPLKVFVVPFSHNDAGWLKTFQEYFESKSKRILDNIVQKMQQLDDMTFVWSEISFLAEWWKSTDMQAHTDFLHLVKTGRLEILTGGWVMPDEAVTHYYALLTQLTEGHQWLFSKLGIIPKIGWSIDPFGHSTTMPYLLRLSGLQATIIQRIHFNWKQYFAKERKGDFMWRQRWDNLGENDLLTHHQPFEIYSVSSSCGPHKKVCEDYDFYYVSNTSKISFKNVKEKLEIILSEYGRTGSLFEHNVILVTLGDDFRFTDEKEWFDQYNNYKALIDYLSSIESYNADIQFGTPVDYFKEINKRQNLLDKNYPILKGDFFPYSDLDTSGPVYWTGFYSTRPYWKVLGRITEANLRSAEILYTLSLNYMKQNKLKYRNLIHLYTKLITARQLLSIFQHHDGVTGTSKHYVMNDYLKMLIQSNINSLTIQSRSIQNILFNRDERNRIRINSKPTFLVPAKMFASMNNKQMNIEVEVIDKYPKTIIIFNPLASWREDVVSLTISSPNIIVKDSRNNIVTHQINPVWYRRNVNTKNNNDIDDEDIIKYMKNNTIINSNNYNANENNHCNLNNDNSKIKMNISISKFEVTFIVEIPALTLKIYTIELDESDVNKCSEEEHTRILMKNDSNINDENEYLNNAFKFDKFNHNDKELTMKNQNLIIKIDSNTGNIKTIENNNFSIDCKHYYRMYKSTKNRSGAYIFKPDYEQIKLKFKTVNIFMITGKIMTEVIVLYDDLITQIYKLYNTNGPLSKFVHVEQIIDIKRSHEKTNIELVTRFKTNIDNGDPPVFYTDSNGFQMQKRVVVPAIGIEGNYYPITTSIYIEDKNHRLTVLSKQSHGVTSNCKGSIEIMLDRRIDSDDNKGMGESLLDNELTSFNFLLVLEDNKAEMKDNTPKLSLLSDHLSDCLIYPLNFFIPNYYTNPSNFMNELNLISDSLPCGVHLVNIRTLTHQNIDRYPLSSAIVTIQRKGSSPTVFDENTYSTKQGSISTEQFFKCKPTSDNSSQVFHDKTVFNNITITEIKTVSLTGLKDKNILTDLSVFELNPFEMGSIKINFD